MANYKKAPTKAQTRVDMLDKLVKEIDPEVILAGALGAIAAQGGVVPPLTKILLTVQSIGQVNVDLGLGSKSDDSVFSDWFNIVKIASPISWLSGPPSVGEAVTDTWKYGSPLLFILGLSNAGMTEDQKGSVTKMRGVMASAALEGMIVMTAVKNPEVQKAVFDALKGLTSPASLLT